MATVITTPTAVSVSDAAAYMSVSEQHIRNLINDGALPASRVGHALRVRVADLDRLLNDNLVIR